MTYYSTISGSATTAGSLASWINSSQVVAAAPTIVSEAESFIYRRLRHWKMLKRAAGTMTANATPVASPTDYIAQPSDFLEDMILAITGTYASTITRKPLQEVVANYCYNASGYLVPATPLSFYTDQTNIYFNSPPDQAYPYLLIYYQQLASLATSGDNFLSTMYPRMLRCALMAGASEFVKDSGQGNYDRTYWENEAEKEIAMAQAESDRQGRSVVAGMVLI